MKNLIVPHMVMSKADDFGGGNPRSGDGRSDDLGDLDDIDEDDIDDDDDVDDDIEDGDIDDDDIDDDDADDDEGQDDDQDDGNVGGGAQKRIRKLNEEKNAAKAEVEDLKKQLEEAKRFSGDDGKALLAAAESAGILPGLMTSAEAEAFKSLNAIPAVLEHYRDWLDDHGQDDELDIGNNEAMTYGQVKKRVRQLETQLAELKENYGQRRGELQAQVRNIFELGLKAVKAGWKPEGKKKSEKKKSLHTRPTSEVRPRKGDRRAEDIDVTDEDSLEAYIAAENRKGKR